MAEGLHYHSEAELSVGCPACGSRVGELCARLVGDWPYNEEYMLYAHASRRELSTVPVPEAPSDGN